MIPKQYMIIYTKRVTRYLESSFEIKDKSSESYRRQLQRVHQKAFDKTKREIEEDSKIAINIAMEVSQEWGIAS